MPTPPTLIAGSWYNGGQNPCDEDQVMILMLMLIVVLLNVVMVMMTMTMMMLVMVMMVMMDKGIQAPINPTVSLAK